MGHFEITIGDFLKNAGIVGMEYMLSLAGAKEGLDYGISENDQAMWGDIDFALCADWTDMYFRAFVEYFGPSTVYSAVLEKIQCLLTEAQNDAWEMGKKEKDDLKFINDKLLSNSYQSGFENIKDKINNLEVYEQLKKDKLKDKMNIETLVERLRKLQVFLQQPLCIETFTMKSIIYNYINRFWGGKCFLLRANAKKDMKKLFEAEFVYFGREAHFARLICPPSTEV